MKGLSPAERKVEDAAFAKVAEQEANLLARYDADPDFGKVVNTDNFRPYFKDVGYNGTNTQAVQKPSSYLSQKAFANGLKKKGEFATFYAGGSGSGKTSAIKNIPQLNEIIEASAVILDGNFSDYAGAIKRLKQAVDAGKKTPIIYVYRDPKDAFEQGVVKRMLEVEEEMGRVVPARIVAENHWGSWVTNSRLFKEGFPVYFIDNSLGKGKATLVSFEELQKKVKLPSKIELENELKQIVKRLRGNGKIDDEQMAAYLS